MKFLRSRMTLGQQSQRLKKTLKLAQETHGLVF